MFSRGARISFAVAAVVALTLTAVPWRVAVPAVPAAQPGAAAVAPAPAVRLQHEFIQIEPPRARKSLQRVRPPHPTTRLARHDGPAAGVLTRARRMFVGDGRFRPEPFPRLEHR